MGARSTEFRKVVGGCLKRLRKEAGYRSAREFAEHIGMNVNTYTNYEQGFGALSLEAAYDITDELGCPLDALVGREMPAQEITGDRGTLMDCYERCTPRRRESLLEVARSMAFSSGGEGGAVQTA